MEPSRDGDSFFIAGDLLYGVKRVAWLHDEKSKCIPGGQEGQEGSVMGRAYGEWCLLLIGLE